MDGDADAGIYASGAAESRLGGSRVGRLFFLVLLFPLDERFSRFGERGVEAMRGTPSPNSSGLEGHVLEAGGAGTSDLGFVSVDEPVCPAQGFHPQGERRLSALVDFTRPVVEPGLTTDYQH